MLNVHLPGGTKDAAGGIEQKSYVVGASFGQQQQAHLGFKKYWLISELVTYNLEPRETSASKSKSPKKVSVNQLVTYNLEPRDASASKNKCIQPWFHFNCLFVH